MFDTTDVLIVDVRNTMPWTASGEKIKGAVLEDPEEGESWANKYPKGKTFVVYSTWPDQAACARVAWQLMERGFTKVHVLKGG